jgi:hypothetical protein
MRGSKVRRAAVALDEREQGDEGHIYSLDS